MLILFIERIFVVLILLLPFVQILNQVTCFSMSQVNSGARIHLCLGSSGEMTKHWLKSPSFWRSLVCVSVRCPRVADPGILRTHCKHKGKPKPEWRQVCGYKFKGVLSFFHAERRQRWHIFSSTSSSWQADFQIWRVSGTLSTLDSHGGNCDPAHHRQEPGSLIPKRQLRSSLSNWGWGRGRVPGPPADTKPKDAQVPYIKGHRICI